MQLLEDLQGFSPGGELLEYKVKSRGIEYYISKGVKYLMDTASSYWLIDEIFLIQHRIQDWDIKQAWKCNVMENDVTLVCLDPEGNELRSIKIDSVKFPLEEMTFIVYWEDRTCNIILTNEDPEDE